MKRLRAITPTTTGRSTLFGFVFLIIDRLTPWWRTSRSKGKPHELCQDTHRPPAPNSAIARAPFQELRQVRREQATRRRHPDVRITLDVRCVLDEADDGGAGMTNALEGK
jgi:hypothetical protein